MKLPNGNGSDFKNIFITYRNGQRFFFQTHSFTKPARSNTHKRFIFLFHDIRRSFPVTALHIFYQSFKGNRISPLPSLSLIIYRDFFSFCSMQNNVYHFIGIILKRSIQIKRILFSESQQNSISKTGRIVTGLPSHDGDRSSVDTETFIRDH